MGKYAVWWIRLGTLTVLLAAPPALAQSEADRTTARELAYEGQEAFDRGDFATAADRFGRADALVHAPTLTLALARAELKLGKVVQAHERYNRILREGVAPGSPAVFREAYEAAEREVEQARAKLAWVTLTVKGPTEADVVLDENQPVPRAAWGVRRAIDPGQHVARASAAGYLPAERRFELAEGAATQLELVLERDPSAPVAAATSSGNSPPTGARSDATPATTSAGVAGERRVAGSTQRTIGYVALGVGGAGVAIGAITGVLAIGKHSRLTDECTEGACPASEQDTLDSYRTFGGISTAGFAVGAASTVLGLTLLLTAPQEQRASARLRLGVTGRGFSLNGAF